MMLHTKIKEIESGQTLEVLATDPSTQRDVPKFCAFLGHALLSSKEVANQYHYVIQKG